MKYKRRGIGGGGNLFAMTLLVFICNGVSGQMVSSSKTGFDLVNAAIYVDSADFPLVRKSVEWLQHDLESVTGKKPVIIYQPDRKLDNLIVVGSLSRSSLIKEMVIQKLFTPKPIEGKWEAFHIESVDAGKLFKPRSKILLITGSDRRGTAYGVLELSKQIGVSPWYWWANVPAKRQSKLYINTSLQISDSPKVKYRGFFINDEAPALSGWTREKFGGFNHLFYEKVFELLLRNKANYLWPAMWGNAFNDDDTLNPVLADEYGIVMGTSHHEPMLRAQQEWKRFGKGAWDYTTNDTLLRSFWKKGIENMGRHESIVTVGMRGDGDMPMTQGTATTLLENIVAGQRKIIEDVTRKPASETPQLWALYKEVQDYYDKGMRVPDDVTLLLADDNWGNLRKLPNPQEKPRKGGYGIYYHFDYVGGPRNYKWINTNNIERVWEQMHLAYAYNAKEIWIVNVGDIKPVEFPLSFFLDYAWNPEKIDAADLKKYAEQWSAAQFGDKFAKEIAELITGYGKSVSRRKPEMLEANTYSFNYNEWPQIVEENDLLLKKAQSVNSLLPEAYKDAFFQLVLHPIQAYANLNDMYYHVALNKEAYKNKWESANKYADKVKALYINDSLITVAYNKLGKGKWNHMMDQKHIGYTSWQEPRTQRMPDVSYVPGDAIQPEPVMQIVEPVRATFPQSPGYNLFYEQDKYISISADHFTKAVNANGVQWKILPGVGRTGSSVTPFPVTAGQQKPGSNAPRLEYEFYTYSGGSFTTSAFFSPSLNFQNTEAGLQYAVSIDDEVPQVISLNKEDKSSGSGIWNKWVADNIIIKNSRHSIVVPGKHILKFWMVDPGVVLQKIVIDFGGLKSSYLGPLETIKK